MKRWILWSIAGVIVLLALGFAVTQVPPAAPYRFLRGWTTVPVDDGSGRLRPARPADAMRTYSVKRDFDAVVADASHELKAHGLFLRAPDTLRASFHPSGSKSTYPEVAVYRDVKPRKFVLMTRGGRTAAMWREGQHAPGWTMVVVHGQPKTTWWDDVCAWLGF